MRPVLHGDVSAAARVLLSVPEVDQRELMLQMLERASVADVYYKRLGRGHPVWGNGSLMAVALNYDMTAEPFLDDPAYCRCWVVVFETLIGWRSERALLTQSSKHQKRRRVGQVMDVP